MPVLRLMSDSVSINWQTVAGAEELLRNKHLELRGVQSLSFKKWI